MHPVLVQFFLCLPLGFRISMTMRHLALLSRLLPSGPCNWCRTPCKPTSGPTGLPTSPSRSRTSTAALASTAALEGRTSYELNAGQVSELAHICLQLGKYPPFWCNSCQNSLLDPVLVSFAQCSSQNSLLLNLPLGSRFSAILARTASCCIIRVSTPMCHLARTASWIPY